MHFGPGLLLRFPFCNILYTYGRYKWLGLWRPTAIVVKQQQKNHHGLPPLTALRSSSTDWLTHSCGTWGRHDSSFTSLPSVVFARRNYPRTKNLEWFLPPLSSGTDQLKCPTAAQRWSDVGPVGERQRHTGAKKKKKRRTLIVSGHEKEGNENA